ncbi:MAG: class II fructose-bisphosphate aldolase [Clostridia bacterium]|nr:class II fructose-bisphosphate aldolase [Clostridia bacterium]
MRHFSTLNEALSIAVSKGIALGAFEFWSFEVARAIVSAAEKLDVPVILQCGEYEIAQMGGKEETVQTAYFASRRSSVPVVLHLDHATTYEACNAAILAGFSSVMIDASALPYEDNVSLTRRVCQRAHSVGISCEGELGRLAGEEGNIVAMGPEAAQTDPDEALDYVTRTCIDALAVSIGTAHGAYTFEPTLNIPRLDAIAAKVQVPIVLHGGSGTPAAQVQESIRHGIRKINICTDTQIAMGKAYIEAQAQPGFKYSTQALWGAGEAAAHKVALEKMKMFSTAS